MVGEGDYSDLLEKTIIAILYTEWKKMEFSKGRLHYIKQNGMSGKPFTFNAHVRGTFEKLDQI